MDRAAHNHYATSPLERIKALDVSSIMAPNSVLFLWATVPMLAQVLEVLTSWRFLYKSNFVWHKNRAGTGYWSRNKHEHLLIGTRGRVPAPAPGTQWQSAIEAPVGRHSAPDQFDLGRIVQLLLIEEAKRLERPLHFLLAARYRQDG